MEIELGVHMRNIKLTRSLSLSLKSSHVTMRLVNVSYGEMRMCAYVDTRDERERGKRRGGESSSHCDCINKPRTKQ